MRTVKIGLCAISSYAQHFPVVEVQQTFYEPPAKPDTLIKWRAALPPPFEITMKAWQLITHSASSPTYRRLKRRVISKREAPGLGAFRDSPIVAEGYAQTLECARMLEASAILFQCPKSFTPSTENVANLRAFFLRIKRPAGVRLLWEPRGDWKPTLLRALCRELDLVHATDPFAMKAVTRAPTYYRLHGTSGARHVYADDELRQLAASVPRSGETYVMFNNMAMRADALRFRALLTAEK